MSVCISKKTQICVVDSYHYKVNLELNNYLNENHLIEVWLLLDPTIMVYFEIFIDFYMF